MSEEFNTEEMPEETVQVDAELAVPEADDVVVPEEQVDEVLPVENNDDPFSDDPVEATEEFFYIEFDGSRYNVRGGSVHDYADTYAELQGSGIEDPDNEIVDRAFRESNRKGSLVAKFRSLEAAEQFIADTELDYWDI